MVLIADIVVKTSHSILNKSVDTSIVASWCNISLLFLGQFDAAVTPAVWAGAVLGWLSLIVVLEDWSELLDGILGGFAHASE